MLWEDPCSGGVGVCGKGSFAEPTHLWEKFFHPERSSVGRCSSFLAVFSPGFWSGIPHLGPPAPWGRCPHCGLEGKGHHVSRDPYLWEASPYSCPGKGCAIGSSGPLSQGRGRGALRRGGAGGSSSGPPRPSPQERSATAACKRPTMGAPHRRPRP